VAFSGGDSGFCLGLIGAHNLCVCSLVGRANISVKVMDPLSALLGALF